MAHVDMRAAEARVPLPLWTVHIRPLALHAYFKRANDAQCLHLACKQRGPSCTSLAALPSCIPLGVCRATCDAK